MFSYEFKSGDESRWVAVSVAVGALLASLAGALGADAEVASGVGVVGASVARAVLARIFGRVIEE